MAQPKKKIRVLITLVCVVAALVVVAALIHRSETRPWTRNGQVQANVVLVAAQVSGQITNIPVKDNQFVKQGELLLEIDPRSYIVAVDQAKVGLDLTRQQVAAMRATVEAAEAGVVLAKAGVESAKTQVDSAKARITAAEHNVEVASAGIVAAQASIEQGEASLLEAQRESERADRLAKTGAGSVQTSQKKSAAQQGRKAGLDGARAGLAKAKASKSGADASLLDAHAALANAKTGLAKAQAQVSSAVAALRQAEATLGDGGEENANIRNAKVGLANAELNLSRTKLYAPTDGWVTNLFAEPGNLANPGAALMTFVAKHSLHVSGYFKETQLRHIRIGDRAVITPMADSSRTFEGVVHSIGWAINPPNIAQTQGAQAFVPQVQPTFEWIRLAQRVPVRIEFKELPEGIHLASGMTVSVAVQSSEDD